MGAPKQRAPFRPPSRGPNPLPAPPEYSCLRQRHLRYYDSIRRRFMRKTSSMGGGWHSSCSTSHAASKNSERPPWDGSTRISFAPPGFQFQYRLPGSKRFATRESCKNLTEAKANKKGTLASADNTWISKCLVVAFLIATLILAVSYPEYLVWWLEATGFAP